MSIEVFNNNYNRNKKTPATTLLYPTVLEMKNLLDNEVTKRAHIEMKAIMEDFNKAIKNCSTFVCYCILSDEVRKSVAQMLTDLGYTVEDDGICLTISL